MEAERNMEEPGGERMLEGKCAQGRSINIDNQSGLMVPIRFEQYRSTHIVNESGLMM